MTALKHIGIFLALPAAIAALILFARAIGRQLRTNRKTGTWLVRYDGKTPWIERRS